MSPMGRPEGEPAPQRADAGPSNRIDAAFERLRAAGRTALIP